MITRTFGATVVPDQGSAAMMGRACGLNLSVVVTGHCLKSPNTRATSDTCFRWPYQLSPMQAGRQRSPFGAVSRNKAKSDLILVKSALSQSSFKGWSNKTLSDPLQASTMTLCLVSHFQAPLSVGLVSKAANCTSASSDGLLRVGRKSSERL